MKTLTAKRILVGISGGIAAYKSAELVRRLCDKGAEVRVVMTRAACEFITPLSLQALSGKPVFTELLDHDAESGMGHIELARWSDVILVAPASANFMARLAHGMADDLLSTVCLAADVPLLIAPAMNQQMWLNSATQANSAILDSRGVKLLGPGYGEQACGETGPGRMLDPEVLIQGIEELFRSGILAGTNITVTAGPTREDIDPVRFISNRSSGKMGYAIAQAALEAGARVTLVSGPVSLAPLERVKLITVDTAEQMRTAVLDNAAKMDIFIAAAAVADYRCIEPVKQKIKKSKPNLSLNLEKTPDILREVANMSNPPFTVGFAAETEALQRHAIEKLNSKNLDIIAANNVGKGLGFDSDENALEIFWPDGHLSLPKASKDKLARRFIKVIAERYHEKNSARTH